MAPQLPVETLRGMTRAKLPSGLRFAVPIEWLIPQVENHPDHGDEPLCDYVCCLSS